MLKAKSRSVLWYIAWLVLLPILTYSLAVGKLLIGAAGGIIFFCFLWFALKLTRCSQCGKAIRQVGRKIQHCPFCGTSLAEQ